MIHSIAAWVFILLLLAWVVWELCYGGGDKNDGGPTYLGSP